MTPQCLVVDQMNVYPNRQWVQHQCQLSDDHGDLRSALYEVISNLNWGTIRGHRKMLEQKYGMGAKRQLALNTAYFITFEDFSNVIDERFGICVITHIRNMSDMPSLQNEKRSQLNLVMAASEIARQYIDDESRLSLVQLHSCARKLIDI